MTQDSATGVAPVGEAGKGHASTGPYGVPENRDERDRIAEAVSRYARRLALTPPLSIEELRSHAESAATESAIPRQYLDYATVLMGNEVWRDTVAGIPYERRILLLPQCLRTHGKCKAKLDEFGLICEECGQCPLGKFQAEAEKLGYVVLIAEGTTVVIRLLEQGRVDAVVGVSCLSALERSFPYTASEAIPGIAIPLNRNGCDATSVDVDRVLDAIRLKSDSGWAGRIDLDDLKSEILTWFTPEALAPYLCPNRTGTENIAADWVAKEGKRWRPLLTASVYRALRIQDSNIPEIVRILAIAVECFHKASLIHDDIEDGDATRYGEMTLHARHGIPIALNAGDLLIGHGYRLISMCAAQHDQRERMLSVASEGHVSLALGQGEELSWANRPQPPSPGEVMEVFKLKTAPAFEVALRLGAIGAGAGDDVCRVLRSFSKSLGIAYQIRDDLQDFRNDSEEPVERTSLLLALAFETTETTVKDTLRNAWQSGLKQREICLMVHRVISELRVEEKARQLYEHYKNEAVRSLNPLVSAHMKGLLRRVVSRILD